jgi:pimeloyl-ACP methyl ester carboxylesterase
MAEPSKKYPKPEYLANHTCTVLRNKRTSDKVIEHPRDKPANIIIIHGVNDVGTGFSEVEEGLCAGLEQRLSRCFKAARYSTPNDKDKVVDDPDAVYFQRKVTTVTDSPVIPFYWGFRELGKQTKTVNGQKTDRYGTRLDKDLSKGGGPFANATSTLPDMWNRGVGAPMDLMGDPLRPLKNGPGRMYMVLAARRLAALIAIIRDYEPGETVTVVAHSQGCLLSLLAQAFLMERGERTADTLVLTHPPYSLEEDLNWKVDIANYFSGGEDAAMKEHYSRIAGLQSLHGRLQTLINIVQGVAKAKSTTPAFAEINEAECSGMVEGRWKPDTDRDNRGKVYLYFSPEDMTVALENMKGIGWQGVPDYIQGTEATYKQAKKRIGRGSDYDIVTRMEWVSSMVTRMPLKELGDSFRQRVFTSKQRLNPRTRKVAPVLIGQPPHDFALCIKGEDDHAHVEESGRGLRASLQVAKWPIQQDDKPEDQRYGIRRINGEPLTKPCLADMRGNQIDADKIPASSTHSRLTAADRGPCEVVDPITAAIAISSEDGVRITPEVRPDPTGRVSYPGIQESLPKHDLDRIEAAYNAEKNPNGITEENKFVIVRAMRHPDGKVIAMVRESRDVARRRWQHEVSAKSFHSAIFDSRKNHSQVTAYDVAIGRGRASSDPNFYAYLCAVADWRLKRLNKITDIPRPGIKTWDDFLTEFGSYFQCEPQWRRELIEGNGTYYSSGVLPTCLPLLTGKLTEIVVSETTGGQVTRTAAAKEKA